MSFSKIRNESSFFRNVAYTFIGINIIKADGAVKKVDINAEAINTRGEDEKDKYKLAIPGLEMGDVIDMYSRVEKEATGSDPIEPLDLVIGGDYPILKYSFSTKIRNNFAVIYTTANGLQDPVESRDDDFIYLKFEKQNIASLPDDIWVYDRRELPLFKINIIPGSSSRKPNQPTKGQVLKSIPKEWLETNLTGRAGAVFALGMDDEDRVPWLKENIKKMSKEGKLDENNKDSLIQYIYYYGRFSYLYDYMSETKIQVGSERNTARLTYEYYKYLLKALNYYHIDYDIVFTLPRMEGTLEAVVDSDELSFFIRARGNQDYYLVPPGIFTNLNDFPYYFEGQDAYVFKKSGERVVRSSIIETLPHTVADFNYSQEKLEVSVNPSNPQQLNITRTKTARGHQALESQQMLTLFEEYVDPERTRFGERTFSDEIMARMGKKKGTELLQEYKQAYVTVRKDRDQIAEKEVENAFDSKPIDFKNLKVLQTGNRQNKRDFIFSEDFTLDGFVKKAGTNYILNIGSFVTGQLQVKADQRKRVCAVNMPYARSFDYVIDLTIPAGYTVEGIDKLNKKMENETGGFMSTAVLNGNKLTVTARKYYKHGTEEAAQWNKMLEYIDAAYDFGQEKILLKKI